MTWVMYANGVRHTFPSKAAAVVALDEVITHARDEGRKVAFLPGGEGYGPAVEVRDSDGSLYRALVCRESS